MTKTKKGFTLVELLVVIAIIGILSAIGLAAFSGTRAKARNTKRIADLRQYGLAMETFADANNQSYALDAACAAGTSASACSVTLGAYFNTNMPADPSAATAACTRDAAAPVTDALCCNGGGSPFVASFYTISATSGTAYTFTTNIETGTGAIPAGYPSGTLSAKVSTGGAVTACT